MSCDLIYSGPPHEKPTSSGNAISCSSATQPHLWLMRSSGGISMMTPDLFSYRRNDPVTSKEAGIRASQFRDGDHALILGALERAQCALAAEQISTFLHWHDHVRVNRRLGELVRAGRIIRTEERHTNSSGRQAFRYRLSP